MANEKNNAKPETPAKNEPQKERSKGSEKWDWRTSFFMNSKTVGGLVLRCFILLVIPYAYLMFCGLVFDMWLKLYGMTPFIFYSLIVLYLAAIAVIVIAIVRYVRATRERRKLIG